MEIFAKDIKTMYGRDVSIRVLTQITDQIIPTIKAWQSRALENVCPIVFLDAMHQKIEDHGCVKTKGLDSVIAIKKRGKKEMLSLYINESEGANCWLQVLTGLQNIGVGDILIACTDNLQEFSEAIQSIFPQTEVQS
ncbi:MAG: transposase [Bacteroidota bacterium]